MQKKTKYIIGGTLVGAGLFGLYFAISNRKNDTASANTIADVNANRANSASPLPIKKYDDAAPPVPLPNTFVDASVAKEYITLPDTLSKINNFNANWYANAQIANTWKDIARDITFNVRLYRSPNKLYKYDKENLLLGGENRPKTLFNPEQNLFYDDLGVKTDASGEFIEIPYSLKWADAFNLPEFKLNFHQKANGSAFTTYELDVRELNGGVAPIQETPGPTNIAQLLRAYQYMFCRANTALYRNGNTNFEQRRALFGENYLLGVLYELIGAYYTCYYLWSDVIDPTPHRDAWYYLAYEIQNKYLNNLEINKGNRPTINFMWQALGFIPFTITKENLYPIYVRAKGGGSRFNVTEF